MAFDAIKAIGQSEAELNGEAGAEKLAEVTLTREQLEANADSVDVNDKALFEAITNAKTALEEAQRGRSFGTEAYNVELLKSLLEATGETAPGEETVWLAEQLGITNILDLDTTAPVVAPEAGKPLASPEQVAQTKATLTKILEAAGKFSDVASMAALVTVVETIKTALDAGGELTTEDFEKYTKQLESAETAIGKLDEVKKKLSPEDFTKLMANPKVTALFNLEKTAELNTFLEKIVTGVEGKTPAQISAFVEAELAKLPSGVDVANLSIRQLIDGVPKSLQNMFAEEYKTWEAAMLAPGATKISFQDYLVKQAEGDEGAQRTLAMKLAIANIVEMLRPFLEMLKSLKGGDTNDTQTPDAPTDAEQELNDKIDAAEQGISVEQLKMNRRAQPIEDFFKSTDGAAVIISEFYNTEVTPNTFDRAKTETYLNTNPEVELANLNTLMAGLKESHGEAPAATLLAQGWSVETLKALAALPKGKIVVTDTTIKIGDQDERTFGKGVEATLIDDIKVVKDATALVVEQKEAASEAVENRNKFVKELATLIASKAEAEDWNQDSYIDAYGENGFYWSGDDLSVDMDEDGGFDWGGSNLTLFNKRDFAYADKGYESWEQLVTDLATVFKDKKVRELKSETYKSSID